MALQHSRLYPQIPNILQVFAQMPHVQGGKGGIFSSHHTFKLLIYNIIEKKKKSVSHSVMFNSLRP